MSEYEKEVTITVSIRRAYYLARNSSPNYHVILSPTLDTFIRSSSPRAFTVNLNVSQGVGIRLLDSFGLFLLSAKKGEEMGNIKDGRGKEKRVLVTESLRR
ncbi:hypothetical protein V1478_015695 [Vespula squamosa]|uniref:Uncharacterized protein n=1 Tax=Vespula squamosa TaxID=30214 RepID=A0ABD2A1L5_VESSQ